MDINEMSVTELKALAFDIQTELARMQQNFNVLTEIIGRKLKEEAQKKQAEAENVIKEKVAEAEQK